MKLKLDLLHVFTHSFLAIILSKISTINIPFGLIIYTKYVVKYNIINTILNFTILFDDEPNIFLSNTKKYNNDNNIPAPKERKYIFNLFCFIP